MKFLSRRTFNAVLAGAAATGPLVQSAFAADPDFSVAIPNDPQYLATLCSSGYSALMQWIVNNQATVVDGSSLNIKAAISGGDCVNNPNTGEASVASTAWGILDSNNVPWMSAPGNHDMVGGSDLSGRVLATNFQAGGFFAADTRAAKSYWGSALPGGGGYCFWGGSYDSANMYMRLVVGAKRQLYMFLEFHPRTAVLEWAKGIHDSYPSYEVIVVMHSYLAAVGDLSQRSTASASFQYSKNYGPDSYTQGASPASNSGVEMWGGAGTFGGFKLWRRLRMIICGHWIWGSFQTDSTGSDTGWVWKRVPATSESTKLQTVHQLFCNVQEADNGTDYSGGSNTSGPCVAGVESAHLFILKFCPSIAKLRFYGLSTHTGNWTGTKGTYTSATPVRLFDVDWAPEPGVLFPLPTPIVR